VFLTDAGKVYSCGHGLGGRLGHGDELTRLVCIITDIRSNQISTVQPNPDLVGFYVLYGIGYRHILLKERDSY